MDDYAFDFDAHVARLVSDARDRRPRSERRIAYLASRAFEQDPRAYNLLCVLAGHPDWQEADPDV
jgi:hypothetical protein